MSERKKPTKNKLQKGKIFGRMRIVIIFSLIFIVNISFSQVKFKTDLRCKITWGNKIIDEYHEEIEENQSAINFSELIKNDNRYIESSENIIVDFIFRALENGSLIGLNKLEGDTLNEKQIAEKINWKWTIDIHHGDTIRWSELEEIHYIKIHQEWEIDTLKNSVRNKIIGVSILSEEEGREILLFYVPFDNKYATKITHDPKIVNIRQMNNKYSWYSFPKRALAKVLTKKDELYFTKGISSNPLNIQNEPTNNLDSLYQQIDLTDEKMPNHIINHSNGIHISQYLYIDYKNKKINTRLNAIGPLFAIHDYKGNFKYYKTLYWLKNKEVD